MRCAASAVNLEPRRPEKLRLLKPRLRAEILALVQRASRGQAA